MGPIFIASTSPAFSGFSIKNAALAILVHAFVQRVALQFVCDLYPSRWLFRCRRLLG
jgi:hypothetical protein